MRGIILHVTALVARIAIRNATNPTITNNIYCTAIRCPRPRLHLSSTSRRNWCANLLNVLCLSPQTASVIRPTVFALSWVCSFPSHWSLSPFCSLTTVSNRLTQTPILNPVSHLTVPAKSAVLIILATVLSTSPNYQTSYLNIYAVKKSLRAILP